MARLTTSQLLNIRYKRGKGKKKGGRDEVISRGGGRRYMGEGVEITGESCEPSNFHLLGGAAL